jgi:hypothetical protein
LEPLKSELLKSEPRKSELRKLEPRKSELLKSELLKLEPRKSELRKSELRKLEWLKQANSFSVPSKNFTVMLFCFNQRPAGTAKPRAGRGCGVVVGVSVVYFTFTFTRAIKPSQLPLLWYIAPYFNALICYKMLIQLL